MGEYVREQRNQLSRVIANNETGSKQLKRFVDSRSNVCGRINTLKAFPNKKCPIQRFVIRDGNKKILSTTENESGKIAEVEKERSTYIQFSNNYCDYLLEAAKKVIGGQQLITSFDYLNKMMEKESESESKSESKSESDTTSDTTLPDQPNYQVRKDTWKRHAVKYNEIIQILRMIVSNPLSASASNIRYVEKNKVEYSSYAGLDAIGAVLLLDQDTEKKDTYVNEINSRLEEMEFERQVCEKQGSEEKPPKEPNWGNDCGKFARAGNSYFDLPKVAYSNQNTTYADIARDRDTKFKGYSFHVWNELTTPLPENKGGGSVTVETCTGKGGMLRAVFGIRPTTKDIKNDIEILDQQGGEHDEYVEKVYEPESTVEKGVNISAPTPKKTFCC